MFSPFQLLKVIENIFPPVITQNRNPSYVTGLTSIKDGWLVTKYDRSSVRPPSSKSHQTSTVPSFIWVRNFMFCFSWLDLDLKGTHF